MRYLAAATLTATALSSTAATPAFPGAEGFGMYTQGGRGGKVYHVTNLSDDGKAGSLRYAVNQKGARTVVFDVSGIIELNSVLNIKNDSITIAGQTAPGDGICLKDYNVFVGANEVIIRFVRFRLGTDKPDSDGTQDRDAIWGRNKSNIIIDHCSMSWCTDECASFYGNKNFTMQWCLVSESLRGSLHPKGYHGYGGIWGGQGASFHHNLVAHHDSRTPRLCGSRYSNEPDLEKVDLRNNVFYNWGSTNSGYAGEGGSYNFVNNYYKSGPATKSSIKYRIFEAYADDGSNSQPKGVYGKFYMKGNYMDGKGDNWDWNGMDVNTGNLSYLSKDMLKSNSEFSHTAVTTHTPANAFAKVCALAGASKSRDAVDTRIANEAKNGTATYKGSVLGGLGIIDKTSDVGGWPTYKSTSNPTDTDGDGMPDAWESANGLNPNDASDGAKPHTSGYTNLERYMNSLVCEIMSEGLSDALTASDYTCDAAETQDSARLIKHGVGGSIQTINKGAEIGTFYFNWENATTVTVDGDLPDGITYSIDNNAKSITFSGAAYDEAGVYNVTVKTVGGINEALYNIEFTIKASDYYVNKQKFNFVVGVDGDFKAAKAAAEANKNGRFYIFVPNGTYNIGGLTGDSNQMTKWSAANVSLIGQSTDGVTLYNKPAEEGIGTTATLSFTSSASNLYLQDLTLQNKGEMPAGSPAARFVAIRDEGKKNIFKNVRLLSGQDTYYSRSDRTYWETSDIHGTVDFICGYGNVFFNACNLYLEYRTSSNVITAPATKEGTWGYVFKDCTIDGNAVNNNKYRLGRSWQGTPKSVYINTKMKILPAEEGWGDPMNVNPALFAEYNSTDAYGNSVNLSKRRSVYTKDGATVYLNPVLSASDAAKYTVGNVLSGTDNWAPDNDCKQVSAPLLKVDGDVINWYHNDSALCYFIFMNGTYIANTADNSFTMPANATESDVFTVRSANAMGGLGPVSKGVNKTGTAPEKKTFLFYYGNGTTVSTQGNDITDKWVSNESDGYGWAITGRNDKSVLYGVDINHNGSTYKTFKCSKGAQNTFYLPKNTKPTKITFTGYTNATEGAAVLSEINGQSVSLPLTVNTSAGNFTSAPAQVSYTFNGEVCDYFTFTFSSGQACFIIELETETCECTQTGTEILNAEAGTRQDNNVYDLFGRRVYNITPGHIYLQNGRKFKLQE